MTDIAGNILGDILEPLRQADRLLSEAIEAMGRLVEEGGEELAEAGEVVGRLADKIAELQAKVRGGGQ
jgi:hypothetical protein